MFFKKKKEGKNLQEAKKSRSLTYSLRSLCCISRKRLAPMCFNVYILYCRYWKMREIEFSERMSSRVGETNRVGNLSFEINEF